MLTRVRLRSRLVPTTIIFNLIALTLFTYRQLNKSHVDFWFLIRYSLFLIFLWTNARALKSRVAELVDLAAYRAGLRRVTRHGRSKPPKVEVPMEVEPVPRL